MNRTKNMRSTLANLKLRIEIESRDRLRVANIKFFLVEKSTRSHIYMAKVLNLGLSRIEGKAT
jgi:hypothetical protein